MAVSRSPKQEVGLQACTPPRPRDSVHAHERETSRSQVAHDCVRHWLARIELYKGTLNDDLVDRAKAVPCSFKDGKFVPLHIDLEKSPAGPVRTEVVLKDADPNPFTTCLLGTGKRFQLALADREQGRRVVVCGNVKLAFRAIPAEGKWMHGCASRRKDSSEDVLSGREGLKAVHLGLWKTLQRKDSELPTGGADIQDSLYVVSKIHLGVLDGSCNPSAKRGPVHRSRCKPQCLSSTDPDRGRGDAPQRSAVPHTPL